MKNIGEIVRNLLKERNIKNVELANFLNVKPQNLQVLLNTENWTFKNVILICDFFKVDIYLFVDNDNILVNDSNTLYQRDPFILLKERFAEIELRLSKLEKKG